MTCVLSMTPLYACSGYKDDGSDLQNKTCEHFDFNWINSQNTHSGLSDTHRCSTPCRIEASTGSTISCRVGISTGLSGSVKHEPSHVHTVYSNTFNLTGPHTGIETRGLEKLASTNGEPSGSNLIGMCKKPSAGQELSLTSQGIKRKAEVDDVYVPSKRVSPFLNTPKERKDERKKILKISIKKLKQLDDPEAFLRRTVLVNNTMKRLQNELREEKLRYKKFESNKKKSFNGYGVLNNSCLSNSYLFDDPFLSGVHEKITDDMTDTLMNNVFHDKPSDKIVDTETDGELSNMTSVIEGKQNDGPETQSQSNTESCNMEICDMDPHLGSSLLTSSVTVDSGDSSKPSSSERNNIHVAALCNDSCRDTLLDDKNSTPEISVDTCEIGTRQELVRTSRCNNNNVENTKIICHDNSETMHCDQYKIESRQYSSEVKRVYHDQNMECDKLHSTNPNSEKSTDVQINCTENVQKRLHIDKDSSFITSKSAIDGLEIVSENAFGLDLLDLDQKLDQKSLSHSFNTFLSTFDISHSVPVSLSYKES